MSSAARRVTIREVADDAGLSIATVSRALTGSRAVGAEVAHRARESAARLGYRADSIGRSLRTQRTNTLGLVIPDIANPFFPSLVQAVERAARSRDLSVLIADAGNDPAVEQAALRSLIDHRVDAVLISPSNSSTSRAALSESSAVVPLIQIDRVIDDTLPFVRVNQARPIRELVAHLRARGKLHFAFIGQPATIATSAEREIAFRELLVSQLLRVVPATTSAGSGREAARAVIERWPETDAIICANDLLGVGALQELRLLGRADVAVSGFDDTLIAEAMGLTSVRQPVDELAIAALAAVLDPDPGLTRLELESTVIFRESTERRDA